MFSRCTAVAARAVRMLCVAGGHAQIGEPAELTDLRWHRASEAPIANVAAFPPRSA